MQNIFKEVGSLDVRCYEKFALSEDILMEHAADGVADFIRANFSKEKSITIICGKSNNGADGLALARLLFKEYALHVMVVDGVKSEMAQLQLKRLDTLGFTCSSEFKSADIIVDALYGTGFSGEFSDTICKLLKEINALHVVKIACDIPSGLRSCGAVAKECFKADFTLTMGALKLSMFSDEAKDFIGDVKVLDLGITRELYEIDSSYKLLEKSDMKLPFRATQNTHKGSFGHLCVVSGEKLGASVISSQAALSFGVGLCTMLMKSEKSIPYEIMSSSSLHVNTTAIAVGMGLGEAFSDSELEDIVASDI
ncbi:MAG: NAD(P)H-hydrate epimerase, partial [Campylobacterota bacterium]|nr:NAD(P)H-hydrate epimerase [Campylobacterota bacterium]